MLGWVQESRNSFLRKMQWTMPGCFRIFMDKIFGKEFKHEGLTAYRDYLRSGNTLVIYRLEIRQRNAWSLCQAGATAHQTCFPSGQSQHFYRCRQVHHADTHTLAEYNRNLIREGYKADINAAKKWGVKFGRQEGSKMKKPKKDAVIQLYKAGTTVQQ